MEFWATPALTGYACEGFPDIWRAKWYTNQRVTSYFYCTSYELPFTYELQVTVYCTSYELLLLHELRVIVYCTSYELLFAYELGVNLYELLFN